MLQPEEFGSGGCVKEAHGGGHAEIKKGPEWDMLDLFYYYRAQLVSGQGIRIHSRVLTSWIHLLCQLNKIYI